jgi:zinc transport system substrate-binding protein
MRKTTAGIVFLMILTLMCGAALAQTRVLATTFPVYQIVRNITQNVPDVEVQLMLPAQAGCPHDYAAGHEQARTGRHPRTQWARP